MGIYLRRKIDSVLENWYRSEVHSPALVSGVRQCGKSRSIKEFANTHFTHVNYINFWDTPDAIKAFDGSLVVDDIIKKLTAQFFDFKFIPGKSILILDEIQECPRARLALKSFKEDKRFEVIASGSYIGLNIDQNNSNVEPKPNGAEDVFFMKTLDFEEYLWANGYSDEKINIILEYFNKRETIPENVHVTMKNLFLEYMCVGGYPEAVDMFIRNKNFAEVFRKNSSLIFDIKGDPTKRKDKDGKPLYTATEISRIQKAFDLIQSFALDDSRRFVLSRINGNSMQKNDALDYLINANVAFKSKNVQVPALPLSARQIESDFKLFYSDIGILIAMCGYDTINALMKDTLGMNKGFLYESVVAESLYKNDIPLYYFKKNSGLEIDFVISYKGYSTLVEVKARNGNTKSSKTVMANPDHYGETKLIKFGDYNIGLEKNILTLPYYLVFALGRI